MMPSDIDALIAKCLAGEASPGELQQLDAWRQASPENEKQYQHFALIFGQSASIESEQYDADVAWQTVKQKLDKNAKQVWLSRPLMRLAASLLLFISLGVWFYMKNSEPPVRAILVAANEVFMDTLPNNIPVALNKQSHLQLQQEGDAIRAVLTGEATFAVTPNKTGDLLVQAGETFIRHIGTTFTVNAYPDSATIEVTVTEGKVHFYVEGAEGIVVEAGGKGIYHKNSRTFAAAQASRNAQAYFTRNFSFSSEPLGRVAEQLNRVYDTKILVSEGVKNCLVSVDFHQESPVVIAEILAETLRLQMSQSAEGIVLTGNACK